MAKFMLLLGGVDPERKSGGDAYGDILKRYGEWTRGLAEQGRLLSTHKLFDGVGARLSHDGQRIVDGPYTESKESIGGFYVIEAEDLAEATRIARECPTVALQKGFVEVRPIEI